MSKHTPGPWRIGPKLQGASFTIVNPNGDAEMGNWLVARAHWEQDARLIAAAPETAAERDRLREVNAALLAALRGMLDIVAESRGVVGYHRNGNEAEWGEFQQVDNARAAIAKAEGQS